MVSAMYGPFSDIRRFEQLDSTNRYLLDEARGGAPEGVVAVAGYQSAGRGRLGRRWEAPPGTNLLTSVLLRPVLDPKELHLCTAAVALAALEATGRVAGVGAGVKWPNDLVVEDRKLAGVLAEADPSAPGGRPGSVAVVVGIGVNVGWAGPPEADGTSLHELGCEVGTDELLGAMLDALVTRRVALETPEGRRSLVSELAERCVSLGRWVRVDLVGESFEGRALMVTPQGHLVVETAGAKREVAAGDVVHIRPAAAQDP